MTFGQQRRARILLTLRNERCVPLSKKHVYLQSFLRSTSTDDTDTIAG